jgi:hypothetical protein
MSEKEVVDYDVKDLALAQAKFATEKTRVEKAKPTAEEIAEGKIPHTNIHKCYHDEHPPRPCEIIQKATPDILKEV